ncbi:MAG: Z1 domain-containing protein [Lentisphaerae bacterium]|nr:Z1 domain-containing protein [Lentisphaerota bacterium]
MSITDILAQISQDQANAGLIAMAIRKLAATKVLWGGQSLAYEDRNDLERISQWLAAAAPDEVQKRCQDVCLYLEDHQVVLPDHSSPAETTRLLVSHVLRNLITAQVMAIMQQDRAEWFSRNNVPHVEGLPGDPGPSRWYPAYEEKMRQNGLCEAVVEQVRQDSWRIINGHHPPSRADIRNKGLVIGFVQSGKTASMAGVISMAADAGYNMFIILSGTKENLRRQTQVRLRRDLTTPGLGLVMHALTKDNEPGLDVKSNTLEHYAGAVLVPGGKCFGVVLKYGANLRALRKWLHSAGANRSRIALLLIDDEADQATPNGRVQNPEEDPDPDMRPSTINELIRDILNGTENSEPVPNGGIGGRAAYLAYTATPFATLLNETGPNTLYPDDLVWHLPRPLDYIGALEICGNPEAPGAHGLDMLRCITDDEAALIRRHPEQITDAAIQTPALMNAVVWFLIASAEFRLRSRGGGKHNPNTTMLLHPHHLTNRHQLIENLVNVVVEKLRADNALLQGLVHTVYEEERGRIAAADLLSVRPDYTAPLDACGQMNDEHAIWDEIQNFFPLGRVSTDGNPIFRVVVDNSTRDDAVRLRYPPEDELAAPAAALVQIVIGGSTLARGLTLQNLVSCYFCRPSGQMDSLLQMGRWYGFRHGYEDLPRIWLSDAARDLFVEGALVESEVYEQVHRHYVSGHFTPAEFGVCLRSNPGGVKLTARMRAATQVGLDYSGERAQTIVFNSDANWLRGNWDAGERLIGRIRECGMVAEAAGENRIYRNVPVACILDFLRQYESVESAVRFDSAWQRQFIEEQREALGTWAVVVKSGEASQGEFSGEPLHLVRRSRLSGGGLINIKSLMGPEDTLADRPDLNSGGGHLADRMRLRFDHDLGPLLVLYPIDQNSRATEGGSRVNLDAPHHVLGAALVYTGAGMGHGYGAGRIVQVRMSAQQEDE